MKKGVEIMPNQTGNITLQELQIKIAETLTNNPELANAMVFDGEGNPATGEIEVDSGDVLIYFNQD
jgi:hypothetical protein